MAGLFVLDKFLERRASGGLDVNPEIGERLGHTVADFIASLQRHDTRAA